MPASAFHERLGDEVETGALSRDRGRAERWREQPVTQASKSNNSSGKSPIKRPRRERCNSCRLNTSIERRVVRREALVVGAVAWPVRIEDRDHESRTFVIAADPAGRLDVFR